MNTWIILQLALLVLAGVLVLLAGAISIRRGLRSRAIANRIRREAAVRPLLMELLADDEPGATEVHPANRRDAMVLESLVWQMLNKVRGSSREVLVHWLVQRNAVASAARRTYSRSSVRRAVAAEQLGNAGVASTAADVIRLLDDNEAEVRIVAARALGKLGDPSSVVPLLGSLEGDKNVPAGIISMSLLHLGPSAVDGLVTGLGNRSATVRAVSAELLGMHGSITAARWLTMLLQHDPANAVRVASADALGRIGSPQALEMLTRSTAPNSPLDLRIAAAVAMGRIGGQAAVDCLQLLLADENETLGQATAEALAGLGAPGHSVLEAATLGDGVAQLRAHDWVVRTQLVQGSRRTRRRQAGSEQIAP